MSRISRERYATLYGPTTGDRFRLADTQLICRVEHDHAVLGEEAVFGGGKTIRDGMAQAPRMTAAGGSPDLVITSALILAPVLGVIKGDIGVKDGRLAAIGKAGNPDIMDGVDPALVIGPGTAVIAGEHMIATPGGVDSHIHMIASQQACAALSNDITTMLGGGAGPADGTRATTTPGPEHRAHDRGSRDHARELGPLREGERLGWCGDRRADRGRRLRAQGPRGLGLVPRRDRRRAPRRG